MRMISGAYQLFGYTGKACADDSQNGAEDDQDPIECFLCGPDIFAKELQVEGERQNDAD